MIGLALVLVLVLVVVLGDERALAIPRCGWCLMGLAAVTPGLSCGSGAAPEKEQRVPKRAARRPERILPLMKRLEDLYRRYEVHLWHRKDLSARTPLLNRMSGRIREVATSGYLADDRHMGAFGTLARRTAADLARLAAASRRLRQAQGDLYVVRASCDACHEKYRPGGVLFK